MLKPKKIVGKDIDPNTIGSLALAYLGDGVYEAAIRQHLVKGGIVRPQHLQGYATHYVSAKAQAGLITKMKELNKLTAEEIAIFKRGRNANSYTHAKNTSISTYKLSTGFEAMIGYLYLSKQYDRLDNLIAWCIEQVENGENNEKRFE